MSLEYEASCEQQPDVAAVARTASLMMRLILDVDDGIVRVDQRDELWHLCWSDSVFAVVVVLGPEFSEIGRWTLTAEMGRRGEALDELLSLIVVAAAATVYGGEVVDESSRLRLHTMDPLQLVLDLSRVGSRDSRSLVNGVKVGRYG